MIVTPEVRARAAKIKILLMDVDGVLCDKMYFLPDHAGNVIEFKGFDAQDGSRCNGASGKASGPA